MKFTDGMEIKKRGPLRTIKKADGWYVVGAVMKIPVKSKGEGGLIIKEIVTHTGRQTPIDPEFLKEIEKKVEEIGAGKI